MTRSFLRSTVLVAIACCALAGCSPIAHDPPPVTSSSAEAPPPKKPPAKLTVAVNVWALTWLVERIGGDLVNPAKLFEAEAHEKPTEPDLAMLGSPSTNAVVYMGNLSAEAKKALDPRAAREPHRFLDLATVDTLDMVPAPPELKEQLPDGRDPHVWLDPGQRMAEIAVAVTRALKLAVSQHPELKRYATHYGNELTKRRDKVHAELRSLQARMRSSLAPCVGRTVVPEHPAYQYLTSAFDLEQLALTRIGESRQAPPEVEAEQEAKLLDLWKTEPAVIFFEHSKGFDEEILDDAERQYFHRLANTHNADLRYLSSLEKPPEEVKDEKRVRTYPEAMLINVEQITLGLECGGSPS